MPTNLPAPAVDDSATVINRVLAGGRYISESDPVFMSLMDLIRDLAHASPVDAAIQRAWAYHLLGDMQRAQEQLESPDLRGQLARVNSERLMLFCNLVDADHVFARYAQLGGPETGHFSRLFPAGVIGGAFRQLAQFIDRARSMHLTNLDGLPLDAVRQAATVLIRHDVQDEDVSRLMGVAGELIREKRVFYLDSIPTIRFGRDEDGQASEVFVSFRLPLSPEDAMELGFAYVDRLDQRGLNLPDCLHIGFSGTVIAH